MQRSECCAAELVCGMPHSIATPATPAAAGASAAIVGDVALIKCDLPCDICH